MMDFLCLDLSTWKAKSSCRSWSSSRSVNHRWKDTARCTTFRSGWGSWCSEGDCVCLYFVYPWVWKGDSFCSDSFLCVFCYVEGYIPLRVLNSLIAECSLQLSTYVKNATLMLACENKEELLLMNQGWVGVCFCLCVVVKCLLVFLCFADEGPYTKHSNPSRPPDGALAIRRQSIPGTKHIGGSRNWPLDAKLVSWLCRKWLQFKGIAKQILHFNYLGYRRQWRMHTVAL